MAQTIKADGHEWKVALSDRSHRPSKKAVVFHNLSDPLRGYRVAEVDTRDLDSEEALHALGDEALRELYDRSQPYDWPREEKAKEGHVGHEPRPRDREV